MGKRQESRERIEAKIIEVGRRHLLTDGAAGLSLRAVAREVGMVSSAVYRYVSSRDELLTLLVVDAYCDLAETVDLARVPGPGWRDEVRAIAHAMRDWALEHPARWALLYGSPVPGYHAPAERTVVPGTRVIAAMLEAIAGGISAGEIVNTNQTAAQPIAVDAERVRAEFGFTGDDGVVAKCFLLWAAVVGAISLEVFGGYGADTVSAPREIFDLQLGMLLELFTGGVSDRRS